MVTTEVISVLVLIFVAWVVVGYFVTSKLLNSGRESAVNLSLDPAFIVLLWPVSLLKSVFKQK